jgi:hypothetical protein
MRDFIKKENTFTMLSHFRHKFWSAAYCLPELIVIN